MPGVAGRLVFGFPRTLYPNKSLLLENELH